jgi:hypothetical protein
MALSAARRRSLQRAYELMHDRAFCHQRQPVPSPGRDTGSAKHVPTEKTHKEWMEERFRVAVQKEFARMGIV